MHPILIGFRDQLFEQHHVRYTIASRTGVRRALDMSYRNVQEVLVYPKLLWFRYKLFKQHDIRQEIANRPQVKRVLDVGCGDGEKLLRMDKQPLERVGIDVSLGRLRLAQRIGLDVLCASGDLLPFASGSFDLIHIAHTLHHIADYEQVLAQIRRCLADDGTVFLVETVIDHPLIRLGRAVHPFWRGDRVETNWYYDELVEIVHRAGFRIEHSGRYNVLFWLWEMAPLAFWPLEIFTPIFVYLDLLLARWFRNYSAHCYLVLEHGQRKAD